MLGMPLGRVSEGVTISARVPVSPHKRGRFSPLGVGFEAFYGGRQLLAGSAERELSASHRAVLGVAPLLCFSPRLLIKGRR